MTGAVGACRIPRGILPLRRLPPARRNPRSTLIQLDASGGWWLGADPKRGPTPVVCGGAAGPHPFFVREALPPRSLCPASALAPERESKNRVGACAGAGKQDLWGQTHGSDPDKPSRGNAARRSAMPVIVPPAATRLQASRFAHRVRPIELTLAQSAGGDPRWRSNTRY